MSDQKLTLFIVSRLAELTAVLVTDYVRGDSARGDRAEARDILLGLGNYAAKHRRLDLAQVLDALAAKIDCSQSAQPLPHETTPAPTTKVRYSWS